MDTHIERHQLWLRLAATFHYLPCWYDAPTNRFVVRRSNLATLAVGLCLSGGYFYHDFFWQQHFLADMTPFTLAIVVLEMVTYSTIPLFIVVNGFVHRKRTASLLNELFRDDALLSSVGGGGGGGDEENRCTRSCIYVRLLSTVIVLMSLFNVWLLADLTVSVFTVSVALRYLTMVGYVHVYNLCVNRVLVRMRQLHDLYARQQPEDLDSYVRYFFTRFELYAAQVDKINRCFSLPLLIIYLMVTVELTYFAYECFRVLVAGRPEDVNYSTFSSWMVHQLWLVLYTYGLILTVPVCQRAWKERHSRILQIASYIYFTPCTWNRRTGQFEEHPSNWIAFVVGVGISVPFWLADIHLTADAHISRASPVLAAVAIIELVVYLSLGTCAMVTVFVRRKSITQLMNVLFRPDWLLDRHDTLAEGRYAENRKLVAIVLFITALFGFKITCYCDSLGCLVLSGLVLVRFVSLCILIFVHRLLVRAIGLRMEQLREFFHDGRMQEPEDRQLYYFLTRFDRYCDQIATIDRCYSFPILLVFLLVMLELVYFLYDFYELLHSDRSLDEYPFEVYLQFTMRQLWQLQFAVASYYTISACQDTSKQVEETARCTRHFDDYRLQNTRAARQIQKFLLKNLHQKKKFSACGFFDIDNTVIYMVFSSIVTYLVILIQFKQLETDLTQPSMNNGTVNATMIF